MPRKKQVIIEIDKIGNVNIDAVGFQGTACEDATRPIERALGLVKDKQKKPEYRQKNVRNQRA
jgi:hypothetical protein